MAKQIFSEKRVAITAYLVGALVMMAYYCYGAYTCVLCLGVTLYICVRVSFHEIQHVIVKDQKCDGEVIIRLRFQDIIKIQ